MQFYLKPNHYSKPRSITIRDEHKNRLFKLKGTFFLGLRQLQMHDMNGQMLYSMRRRYDLSFLKKYTIEDEHGNIVGIIQRTYGFFAPKFKLTLLNEVAMIEGSMYQHEFSLSTTDATLVSIQKKVFASGDAYEITIEREKKPLLYLFALISIDQFLHESRKHRENM